MFLSDCGQFGGGASINYTTQPNAHVYDVLAGDFNHDGHPDIAVLFGDANHPTAVEILFNDSSGHGHFTAGTTTFPLSVAGTGTNSYGRMVVGDFDGKNGPDLAVLDPGDSNNPQVWVLLNKGDGTFGIAQSYTGGDVNCWGIAAADFNNDGKLDLVLQNGQQGVTAAVLYGNGDGTFQAQQSNGLPQPALTGSMILAGDLTGTGLPSIVELSVDGPGPATLINYCQ